MVMFDVVSIFIFSIQVYFRDEHKLAIMAALFIKLVQGGPDAGPQLQDVLDHPGKSFHQHLLAFLCLLDIEDL